jgi:ammonium transporter, Amt family
MASRHRAIYLFQNNKSIFKYFGKLPLGERRIFRTFVSDNPIETHSKHLARRLLADGRHGPILLLPHLFDTQVANQGDLPPYLITGETMTRRNVWMMPFFAALLLPSIALAEDAEVSVGVFTANNAWMMLCAGLVFIMHLGFATLESGLTRAKNVINILFKNTFIVCVGLITYFVIGFKLMYPGEVGEVWNGIFASGAFADPGLTPPDNANTVAYASGGYTYYTDFLFQAMFAATAATIVSGAVAERIKLKSFMVFATLFVGLVYPIAGSWKWGTGWLDAMGFYDFAGSTLVHSVGGWGALVGAMMLGPRLGKYGKNGAVTPIPGSNMPLAAIGVFLLWLGWFGFNGGSVLSADPAATSLVLVTTCLAAAAGGLGAMAVYSFVSPKPDVSMALNGILAGLVGITAGADQVTPVSAVIIGLFAGGLVVGSVLFFDKIKVDDPVGAVSVHLVCGIWGTLAVGIFSQNPEHSFVTQLIGVLAYGAFTAVSAGILFFAIKATMGLRVEAEEEVEGLDYSEHGAHGYVFEMGASTSSVGHATAAASEESAAAEKGSSAELASSES